MKYFLGLIMGFAVGVALFAAGMYFNPLAGQPKISPLATSGEQQVEFSFPAVPSESLLYTDNGETNIGTNPIRVAELWEPTLVDSQVMVTLLENARGEPIGLGIKYASRSEDTKLINSKALVNSAWHIYVPGRGTLMVGQVENYWSYLREIVVPARWSSGNNWKGSFFRVMTDGPGALGTGRVVGGSGEFAGMSSEAVETLRARAYSSELGPVSMDGQLTVTLSPTFSED